MSNHATWRAVALDLQAAAEKLWPEIEGAFRAVGRGAGPSALREGLRYRGPFYLLAALAVENFAKALIAKDRLRQPLADRDLLVFGRGNHLARLSQDAGVRLTRAEEVFLMRLTRSMRWRGRYPTPAVPRQAAEGARSIAGTADLRELRKVLAKFEEAYQRVSE